MINPDVSKLLGFACELDDEGTFAVIDTPFVFQDKDPLPMYVEEIERKLRIFDDGQVLWHFKGIGVHLNGWDERKVIRDLARQHDVTLNSRGELEVWADSESMPEAFARYLSALFEIVRWEREYSAQPSRSHQEYFSTGEVTINV